MKENSFGIIPFYKSGSDILYLIIQHVKKHWGFPKGHAEKNETEIETARREFTEETGIQSFDIVDTLVFEENYRFTNKKGHEITKRVTYFPAEVHSLKVEIQPEEINNFKWGNYNEITELITFKEGRDLLQKAHREIINLHTNH